MYCNCVCVTADLSMLDHDTLIPEGKERELNDIYIDDDM